MSTEPSDPKRRPFLGRLGPGLITGAADDDPGGIATHSQVGAQFGLGLIWMPVLAFPLMTAIQAVCARIGRVTGVERTGFKHKDGSRTPATVVTTEDAKGNETRQIATDASRWGIFGR